jgi:aflatoxin B1 aldehyde reductase
VNADVVRPQDLSGGGDIESAVLADNDVAEKDRTYVELLHRHQPIDPAVMAAWIVEQAAEKHGLSMIEIALRWTVHHSALKIKDGNDGILIGVSSVAQLDDNLNNLEKGPLPEGVVKALDEAWEASKGDSVPYWHGELKYEYDTQASLFGPGAK